jgi:hypothetical protein
MKKISTLRGQKAKIGPQSPKTEFGAQNQNCYVIHPSIGNFTWSKKKLTFRGRKGENKPSELKNGICGPNSIWSCDISNERKFYMEQEPKTEFEHQNQYGRVIYPSIGNFI